MSITIRDVPEDVRASLATQAAERGQSMQAFLFALLERQASFAQNRQLLADVDIQLATTPVSVGPQEIVAALDAGREARGARSDSGRRPARQ